MNYPIESSLEGIKQALAWNKNLILTAEPGAGKSTVVPLALMNEAWLEGKKIVMLQPRRVAAVAVANRMSETHGSEPGKSIGYSVRFSSNIKPSAKIEVLTEGILTKRIQKDPFLEDVGLVIFDEFHERSIHADLGLALCCEIKRDVRPDLRLMVMSATIDTEFINNYLDNSEVISEKGFLHPVSIEYKPVGAGREYFDNAAKAIYEIVSSSDKNEEYLVFLPGIGEINRVKDYLESTSLGLSHDILTLHGSMNIKDQQRVLGGHRIAKQCSPLSHGIASNATPSVELSLASSPTIRGEASKLENGGKPQVEALENSRPRIILSTNIAETSLTIEGITTVIDTGYARQNQFNAETGLNKLEMVRISKASAKQRAGRAGRLRAGRAIRLYSKAEIENFAENEIPEILRSDPTSSILELYSWGIKDPFKFNWLENPSKESIEHSIELLKMLGAVDENNTLTELGKKINNIPAEPRLAAMLINAKEAGCLEEAALATAIIEEKDFLTIKQKLPQSIAVDPDLLLRLLAFENKSALPDEYSVDSFIMKRIVKEQKQLLDKLV
jgi:ATP-dependent helicase HrpB